MLAHTTPVGYLGPARAGRLRRLANIGKPGAYHQKMRLLLPPAAALPPQRGISDLPGPVGRADLLTSESLRHMTKK